jgi:DNA-binding MarR family transcriptional regulator
MTEPTIATPIAGAAVTGERSGRTLASTDDAPLTNERIATINRMMREYDSLYSSVAVRLGVPDSVFDTLYTLYLHDGATQKEICDISYVSKQTIHSAVMRLERDGLIRTERGHGRAVKLFLTDTGRVEAARIARPVVEVEQRAYDVLSPREFDELLGYLDRIADQLRRGMDAIGSEGKEA